MENQLGARIAKLRRACGLTQETLGGQLGVSAAAVSKWETGAACPDVTLLCPLARALHTNVNALLAFEQRLTREQLTAFSETFVRHVRDGRQREAQEDMARLLMEYPGDTALRAALPPGFPPPGRFPSRAPAKGAPAFGNPARFSPSPLIKDIVG